MMPFFMIYCALFLTCVADRACWKRLLSNKWIVIIILIFLGNSIYRSREFLPAPVEVHLATIEMCNDLGYPRTALNLLKSDKGYVFERDHRKRMYQIRGAAHAELYLRDIEHLSEKGSYKKVLKRLNKARRYHFSAVQEERIRNVREKALDELYGRGKKPPDTLPTYESSSSK